MAVKRTSRAQRADATRGRMVVAARELFLDQGYAATSIAQIASRAGVAVQTVYWAFGTKAALVRAIREQWLAEARTGERLRAVLEIAKPGARLDATAAFMRGQWETGAAAIAVMNDASRADPAIAAETAAVLEERATRLAAIVDGLGERRRTDLTAARAVDVLLALLGFELYRDLRARGWSADDYEAWLARTLRDALLERRDGRSGGEGRRRRS